MDATLLDAENSKKRKKDILLMWAELYPDSIKPKQLLASMAQMENNYEEAISSGEKALAISQNFGIAKPIENASKLLYLIYKKSGQSSKALDMLEVCIDIRENSNKEEINNILQKNEFEIKIRHKYRSRCNN